MAYDGIAKVQHYVPRFLLRNFGTGKKDKLHVFDKQAEKSFVTNVKNVAAESRFYDFEFEGRRLTIEPGLSTIESAAKPIIKSILDEDGLAHLTGENRARLSIFLGVQFTRTRWYRDRFREMPKQLEESLRRKLGDGVDLSSIADYIKVPDDNELGAIAARSILRGATDYPIHFANKMWVLLAADPKNPFLIGDNPVGLQNTLDMGPFGNIGLDVSGIEIYFPLSPRRALAMWCPSLEDIFKGAAGHKGLGSFEHLALDAIENGRPLGYSSQRVLNFNSIQVLHAERFVYSSVDDMSLVQTMLCDNDRYRAGPRFQVR